MKLNVNGKDLDIDVDPQTPLLWVLRDTLNMTGTKYGCGIAQCGACTVHLDGKPTRSCQTPVGDVGAAKITTIEGLSADRSHPVQRAWIELDVPQCGYCQSGQILAAAAFSTSGVGAVLGIAFAALVVGPKMLETAVVKVSESAPETDDEFAKRFQELVDENKKKHGAKRLVVFIDELDRCAPADVVATLVDLKTFLDIEACVFIVAADRGSGRRTGWLSNYHLAVRDGDGFAPVGKTFKGLTDAEFAAMTERLRTLAVSDDGYTVRVQPAVVVEVAYNEIQRSPQYSSGLALRFARITRIREDKSAAEATTLAELQALFARQSAPADPPPSGLSE